MKNSLPASKKMEGTPKSKDAYATFEEFLMNIRKDEGIASSSKATYFVDDAVKDKIQADKIEELAKKVAM